MDYIESLRKDKKNKFRILFTPFDENSLNYLIKKNIKLLKYLHLILQQYLFLEQISKYKIKIIMSSGMSKINDINNAIKTLTANKKYIKKILIYSIAYHPILQN